MSSANVQSRPLNFSILLIIHSYPPGVVAGSEIEAQRISEALIRRGHSVTVVCVGRTPMPDQRFWTDPKGIPVQMYARHWTGPLRDWIFALQVGLLMIRERQKYDAIYFLMQGAHLLIGLPVAKLLKKPILMKISSSIIVPQLDKTLLGRLELHWIRKWARTVMILNDQVKQQAMERGFSQQQLVWMPNPVDTNEFSPVDSAGRSNIRARLGVPDDAFVVLYCGRLAPVKELPSLLDAFAIVVRKVPRALLVILGEGPSRPELTKQAQKLGLNDRQIWFKGRLEPKEIPDWSRISDIFVLVSCSEGFSCALVEAMSSGLACVVSDIPANQQLIKSELQGLLTAVGDSEAIASALIRLAEDHRLRELMGRTSRQSILQNYSVELVADRYESLIFEAMQANSRC